MYIFLSLLLLFGVTTWRIRARNNRKYIGSVQNINGVLCPAPDDSGWTKEVHNQKRHGYLLTYSNPSGLGISIERNINIFGDERYRALIGGEEFSMGDVPGLRRYVNYCISCVEAQQEKYEEKRAIAQKQKHKRDVAEKLLSLQDREIRLLTERE